MEQTPIPPPEPQPTDNSNSYIGVGVMIGVILALVVMGGIYYKNKLDTAANLKTNMNATTPAQQGPTNSSGQPTVKPINVNSVEDLKQQEALLDTIDMSSVAADLLKNTKDAAQFAP